MLIVQSTHKREMKKKFFIFALPQKRKPEKKLLKRKGEVKTN